MIKERKDKKNNSKLQTYLGIHFIRNKSNPERRSVGRITFVMQIYIIKSRYRLCVYKTICNYVQADEKNRQIDTQIDRERERERERERDRQMYRQIDR